MKKLKILPSIVMLIACIAILGVGVFAIAPTQNTITGTITINASNTPITIKVYENDASGTLLAQADARAGATLSIGNLSFDTQNANDISDVKPIRLAVIISTTSTEQLVVDTETIESLHGVNKDGETTQNIVSVTKLHLPNEENDNGLACFSNEADYQIICTFRLVDFVNENLTVNFNLNFDVYKASEYTGDGINGVDYLYFGAFPQSEALDITGLTKMDKTFGAYDDATGEEIQREVYTDGTNEYVKLNNKYFKIEPLKWNILTESVGIALLVCDNIVEQVAYQNDIYDDSAKEYHTEDRIYVKGEDGKPLQVDGKYIYANNYEYSDLRRYLTQTFYNYAFNNLQKQLIPLTEVNNKTGNQEKIDYAIETNEYAEATNNTTDYVFALSYDDLVNADYGFAPLLSKGENVKDAETAYYYDMAKMKQNTGYSTATGAYTLPYFETFQEFTSDCCCGEGTLEDFLACVGNSTTATSEEDFLNHIRNSGWWALRTADSSSSLLVRSPIFAYRFTGMEEMYKEMPVWANETGCVPALNIDLAGWGN